jgi:hypothetical protein
MGHPSENETEPREDIANKTTATTFIGNRNSDT